VADYRAIVGLAGPARGSSILGRTEPDLHLIKQVEQVTIPRLEDRPGATRRFRAREPQTR